MTWSNCKIYAITQEIRRMLTYSLRWVSSSCKIGCPVPNLSILPLAPFHRRAHLTVEDQRIDHVALYRDEKGLEMKTLIWIIVAVVIIIVAVAALARVRVV